MSVEILDLAALALTAVFFALLYYLHKKKHVDFGVRTILAVGLGLIVGLAFKGHHVYVAAVGTVYAHVVSAVVIPLLSVLVLAYILCAIQLFVVEGVLVKLVGKLDPVRFFKGIWPAATVAFTSQSSVGTIPVTVNQLTKKLGVNEDVAAFGASLGANLGMPGCAGIWPTLLAVFTIHLLGIEYTPVQYAFLVVLAVVVSIGTVGVPGTATITATALFAAAGLPVEAIILLSPISSIVDMARTATNVVGAAAATTLVAATEGQLDEAVYNGEAEVPAAEAV